MPDAPAPIPYLSRDEAPPRPVEEQPFDKGAQWIMGVLALVMTIPFAVAVPLCVYVIWTEPRRTDLVIVVALLCAIGMTIGLGGAGIGMIRRARRKAEPTPPDPAQP